MRRIAVIGLAAVIVPFLAGCGIFQEIEEPSGTIEAIPLELEEDGATDESPIEPTAAPAEEAVTEEPTAAPVEEVAEEATSEPMEEAVEESTAEPVEEPTETAVEEAAPLPDGPTVYAIVPEQSLVRFELDEDLRGNRITVVGSTDQVSGQMAFDFADLSSTQVGIIQINARTLVTDNNFRNRAINNEILDTGEFEFITFEPSSVEGLPDSIGIGEAAIFSIVGTLTIRDISQEVTFDVTATAASANQIIGNASTVIALEDYDINIPSVPSVANVEEEVELYIDFIAAPTG